MKENTPTIQQQVYDASLRGFLQKAKAFREALEAHKASLIDDDTFLRAKEQMNIAGAETDQAERDLIAVIAE